MRPTLIDLYVEIQQFYATQVQHLGVRCGSSSLRTPSPRTAGIVAALSEYQERRYGDDPTQHRHWFNMLNVMLQDDGSIVTSYYAVVLVNKIRGRASRGWRVGGVEVDEPQGGRGRRDGVLVTEDNAVDRRLGPAQQPSPYLRSL